ncbi:MAG: outer membrane beta-barrel protein [Vicinamibacterales bacterium]
MKRFVQVAGVMCLAAFGLAAQAAAQPKGDRPISIEFGGGPSFGGSSSGTYGVDLGYAVTSKITVFLEAGQIGNVAPGFIVDQANTIAKALGGSADIKDKATFGEFGVKYMLMPNTASYQPYVGFGVGAAKVEKKPTFTIGGASLNEEQLLAQYGVQLGSDLAGSTTKTTFAVLAGVTKSFGERFGVDVSYRYNRIMPKTDLIDSDEGINAQRLFFGALVRF